MNDRLLFQQVDERLREYLRSTRSKSTHHRAVILQVFLRNTKPVTAKEVHWQVKAQDVRVSWHCVYQTLGLLVQSGLAKEIIPDDGTARLYTHELAIAKCTHSHLICKDCGAIVDHKISMEEEYAEALT